MALDLLPYQDVGADFLASKFKAGLFDRPGLGKSAQAIRGADKVRAMRVVVICPAAVRQVWLGEFAKFQTIERRVLKCQSLHDLNLWLRRKVDVLVMSYEKATSWSRWFQDDLIDLVIFDEAHYLKDKESMRTRALLSPDCDGKTGLAKWAARVWFLTGTPNPNDSADIWSIARFCGATPLTQKIFRDRYYTKRLGAYSAQHTPRDAMLPELRQVIQSFSRTRNLNDAGVKLPPIWTTTMTVDGDTQQIKDLLAAYPGLEKAIKDAVDKGGLSFLDAQHIATLRRLVGEAKAPAYVEILKEELRDGTDKVVVFGIHVRALDIIAKGLHAAGIGCVTFNGSTIERDREKAIRAFEHDPGCRVFLANFKAGGTGLTLVTAHRLDMFEYEWAPATNAQGLLRVHRIGQTKSVHARHITLANSIDDHVGQVVARKTAAILKTGFEFAA